MASLDVLTFGCRLNITESEVIRREAAAAGRGSFQIDGKMIDIPVVVRAQKLIKRYDAIKAREAMTIAAMKD